MIKCYVIVWSNQSRKHQSIHSMPEYIHLRSLHVVCCVCVRVPFKSTAVWRWLLHANDCASDDNDDDYNIVGELMAHVIVLNANIRWRGAYMLTWIVCGHCPIPYDRMTIPNCFVVCVTSIVFFVRRFWVAVLAPNGSYFWFQRAFSGACTWQETHCCRTKFTVIIQYSLCVLDSQTFVPNFWVNK